MSCRRDNNVSSISFDERELEFSLHAKQERIRNLDKQLATMDALHFPTTAGVSDLRTFTNGKIHCISEAEIRTSSSSADSSVNKSSRQERLSPPRDSKDIRQERRHPEVRTRYRERRQSHSKSHDRERRSSRSKSRQRQRQKSRSKSRDRERRISASYSKRHESSRDRRRDKTDRSPVRNRPHEKRWMKAPVESNRRSPESTSSSSSRSSISSSKSEQHNHGESLQVPKPWVLPEPKDTTDHPTAYERLSLERFEIFFREVATILGTRLVCSKTYTLNGMQSVSIGFEKVPPEFLQGVCAAMEGYDKDTVDLRCYQLLVTHFVKMGILYDDFPSYIYRYKSFGSFIANYLKPLCEKLLSQRAIELFRSLGSGNVVGAVGSFQKVICIESAAFWKASTRTIVDSYISYQRSDYKEAVSRVELDRPNAPKCVSINNSSTTTSTSGPISLMTLNIPPPMMHLPPAPARLSSMLTHPPHMSGVPSTHLYTGHVPQMVSHQMPVCGVSVAQVSTSFVHGSQVQNPPARDEFCQRTDDFLAKLAERNQEDAFRQRMDSDRSDSPPPRFLVAKSATPANNSFGSPVPLPRLVSHNVPSLEKNAFHQTTKSAYVYPPNISSGFQSRKRNRSDEPDNDYDLVFS